MSMVFEYDQDYLDDEPFTPLPPWVPFVVWTFAAAMAVGMVATIVVAVRMLT